MNVSDQKRCKPPPIAEGACTRWLAGDGWATGSPTSGVVLTVAPV
jgi:hypothetical protein